MANIVMNHGDKRDALKALTIITRMLGRRGVKASHFKAEVVHHSNTWFNDGGFLAGRQSGNISVSLSLEMRVPIPRKRHKNR